VWTLAPDAENYTFQIAVDPAFNTIVESASGLTQPSYTTTSNPVPLTYYWRVIPENDCGTSVSNVFSLTFQQGNLPVELTRFEAQLINDFVELNWATASETNNAGFEIQRMDNNNGDFSTIGWLDSKSETGASYDWPDREIEPGKEYLYRLKQLDLDGTFSYSPIKSIKIPSKEIRFDIHPNPVRDVVTVSLDFPTSFNDPSFQLSLYNLDGQLIKEWQFSGDNTSLNQALDIADISNGIYLLRLKTTDGDWPLRLVKM